MRILARGIGGRLIAAFGAALALTFVSIAVGFLGLDRIVNDRLPVMASSLQLAEHAAHIEAIAPSLAAAGDAQDQAEAVRELAPRKAALTGAFDELTGLGADVSALAAQ